MKDVDWGLEEAAPPAGGHEVPRENTEDGRPAADPEADIPPHARECPTCHRLPLHEDPRAAALLLERIREDARDRLSRTEGALAVMHEGDRIAVAAWIQAALDRPPLVNARARTFVPIVAVLDALWRDIYWTTPDPLVEIAGDAPERVAIPSPHHELAAMREEALIKP